MIRLRIIAVFFIFFSHFALQSVVLGQEETGAVQEDQANDDEVNGDNGDDTLVNVNGDMGYGTGNGNMYDATFFPADPNASCSGPRTAGELRAYLLRNGYDKYTRPGVAEGLKNGWHGGALLETHTRPDVARVQLHILALKSVDQKRNEFKLSAWYRRKWKDPRLAFKTFSEGGCFPEDASIGFPKNMASQIWNPDFYIENVAEAPKETGGAVWIQPDGTVLWSSQMEMTLACRMEFEAFPFDIQHCFFKVGTWLEDQRGVSLAFFEDRDPVTLAYGPDLTVIAHGGSTEWEIVDHGYLNNVGNIGSLYEESTVVIELFLKRNSDYYVAFVMVPSIMFVIISWSSFFISRSAAPARVAMSIICFLTNTNFLNGQLGQLPRVGNEAWLLRFLATSTYFTFYAVLEYCLCNYLFRIEARIKEARKDVMKAKGIEANNGTTNRQVMVTKKELIENGFNRKVDLLILNPRTNRMYFKDEHVDVFSRWVYPLAYLVVFMTLWFRRVH